MRTEYHPYNGSIVDRTTMYVIDKQNIEIYRSKRRFLGLLASWNLVGRVPLDSEASILEQPDHGGDRGVLRICRPKTMVGGHERDEHHFWIHEGLRDFSNRVNAILE